jgi:hypothetical protein
VCGPSQAEQNLANQQAAFTSTLQQDYSQTFAQNQQILGALNSVLQPIVLAGPNQQGFNQQELSALNSQAINSNAQGVQQAETAAGQQENALGGGKSFLPSGVNAQINAGIATAGEENLSNAELGITEANYATGRQNWQNALSGEQAVASGQQPLGYANAGINSNTAAFNEANTVSTQTNQEWSNILGDITGGILGGTANMDTAGTSTPTEQTGNILTGILSGL